jgi:hypothetical protein
MEHAWAGFFGSCAVTTQTKHVINFAATNPQLSRNETLTLVGARKGDGILVAPYPGAVVANSMYTGFVSDKDEVTVVLHNYSAAAINPGAGTFMIYRFHQ